MKLGLESAVIPVSGGASGIGLAICRALRAVGALPLLVDSNAETLQAAVADLYPDDNAGRPHGYVVDVRDCGAVHACFEQIKRDHGAVTHAVANAGVVDDASILDAADDQWRRVIDINLTGVMYFCRDAVQQMAASKKGSIVTTASLAGLSAKARRIAYSASKAGVVNLTRAMALDLGSLNIRANAVAPGIIDTPIQARKSAAERQAAVERIALGRTGSADEIAKVVLFLLSDWASYVSGETIIVDGGLMARYS